MPVTKATHDGVVRENRYLNREIDDLNDEIRALRLRNAQVLSMVSYAHVNLVPVFGKLTVLDGDAADAFLTDLGYSEVQLDTYLVFRADNGLAMVRLNPATGEIIVSDPNSVVRPVRVTLDLNGDLDTYEITTVRNFQAAVLFAQQFGNGYSGGKVSVSGRPVVTDDSATPVDEPPAPVTDDSSSEDKPAPQA